MFSEFNAQTSVALDYGYFQSTIRLRYAAQRICALPSFDRWCQQGIHTRVRKPTNLVGLNELNIYISFDFNINGKTERHQTPKGW